MLPFGELKKVVLPDDPYLLGVILTLTVKAVTSIMVSHGQDFAGTVVPIPAYVALTPRQASFETEAYDMELGLTFASDLTTQMFRFHIKTSFMCNCSGLPDIISWSMTPMGSWTPGN